MPTERALTRREFIRGAGIAVASLPFLNLPNVFAEGKKRPNFVFIFTDDQRYDAMSCAGHPFMHTPNMDRIAKEGVRFTNAFVTISLCSPSRACFLTGQYAHKHGVTNNSTPMSDSTVTFPRLLQQAGYDTAFIGKWHMDGQDGPRPGFGRWVSFKGQGVYTDPLLNVDGEKVNATGYTTDILTDYAVNWLKQPRDGKPFLLYMPHKACHAPMKAALRHEKLYEGQKIGRPENFDDNLEGRPEWFKLGMEKGHDFRNALGEPMEFDEYVRNYCRTLMAVDDSVGRIFKTLEEMGELDNTVIVFSSDNGFFLGEHHRIDKRTANEESMRIPMLMRYPKMVPAGTVRDEMVLNIDVAPTFLELAGVKVPDTVQGRSWCDIFKHGKPWRKDFMYEYFVDPGFRRTPTMYAVRGERWKYIEYPDVKDIGELYDLKNDPTEMHNLISDPKYADVLAKLRERLQELKKQNGA